MTDRMTWLQAVLLSHIAEPDKTSISEENIERVASLIEGAAIEFRRIDAEGTGDPVAVARWLTEQLARFGVRSRAIDVPALKRSLLEPYRLAIADDTMGDLAELDVNNDSSF